MKEFITKLRNDHSDFKDGSLEDDVKHVDPMLLFHKWYEEAYERGCSEPHAVTISTVDASLQPSSRTVYLKEIIEEGMVFYTNYQSKKAKDIEQNPKVAALFYWDCLERQVRLNGVAEKIPADMSDDYFNSRPRGSQLGAWASRQSDVIKDRDELDKAYAEVEQRFEGKDVPRPDFWGGYLIRPTSMEFWQGRPSRLHDRICFEKNGENWEVNRKNP
jgi:pyridoxamine 5'-phosphate oxidase